jgi:predicted phage-related endonuclease
MKQVKRVIHTNKREDREAWNAALDFPHLSAHRAPDIMNLEEEYFSPLKAFCEIKGIGPKREKTDGMYMGEVLEEAVRQQLPALYERAIGDGSLRVRKDKYIYQSLREPWMTGGVDGWGTIERFGKEPEKIGVEIKTTSVLSAKNWEYGNIPEWVRAQVQYYMGLFGCDKFFLGVMIGKKMIGRIIERDPDYVVEILRKGSRFVEHYLVDNEDEDGFPLRMPEPTGKECDQKIVNYFCRKQGKGVVDVSGDIELWGELESLHRAEKKIGDQVNAIKNQIKLLMGEAETAQVGGKSLCTYRTVSTKRLDVTRIKEEKPDIYEAFLKETSSRVLRPNYKAIEALRG